MKIRILILLLFLSSSLFAQRYNGLIFDKTTGSPIPNALIKFRRTVQLSAYDGYFNVNNVHFGDTIKITSQGYQPYNLYIGMLHRDKDTARVFMDPSSVMLNNVTINAKRNHLLDSINARKEFAKVFAYKAPTIADAFLTRDPYVYQPDNFITSEHTTAAIVGVDLTAIASLFAKNNSPDNKLHELAVKNEQLNYVDRRFSKNAVASVTKLSGDALHNFIIQYRPSYEKIKTMTDYDIIVYIKKCNTVFASR